MLTCRVRRCRTEWFLRKPEPYPKSSANRYQRHIATSRSHWLGWLVFSLLAAAFSLSGFGCFGGTTVRGLGSSCYNGGTWSRTLGSKSECGKGLRCSGEFDHFCVQPVSEGQACDGWPHPNPYKPKGYRYCTVWGSTPDSHGTTQLGRCWKGRCVRAQKKGQVCTDPSGPGPWCLTPGGCRNGRCISD